MDEDILMKATMLKQESEEVERGLEYVDEQISELEQFSEAVKALGDKNSEDILTPLGKGVYMKTKKEDAKLFIEVGAGVVLRKTTEETQEILSGQLKRLKAARLQLRGQLEGYATQFQELLRDVEKIKHSH